MINAPNQSWKGRCGNNNICQKYKVSRMFFNRRSLWSTAKLYNKYGYRYKQEVNNILHRINVILGKVTRGLEFNAWCLEGLKLTSIQYYGCHYTTAITYYKTCTKYGRKITDIPLVEYPCLVWNMFEHERCQWVHVCVFVILNYDWRWKVICQTYLL